MSIRDRISEGLTRFSAVFGRKRIPISILFGRFQEILALNNRILETMADMGDKLSGNYIFDKHYIEKTSRDIIDLVQRLVFNFSQLAPWYHRGLDRSLAEITQKIEAELIGTPIIPEVGFVLEHSRITGEYADLVGGKNAVLSEIANQLKLKVPFGFAITTKAYEHFISHNRLEKKIDTIISRWNSGELGTKEASHILRNLIVTADIPAGIEKAIRDIIVDYERNHQEITRFFWAVRSSAVGEGTEHSFAGQFESLLNVPPHDIPSAYRQVLASIYSPEAMDYRRQKHIEETDAMMAVVCQKMVDAVKSGVIDTINPIAPQSDSMVLNSAWGLGASVIAGKMNADEYNISRESPFEVLEFNVVRKETMQVLQEKGGILTVPVSSEKQTVSSLSEDEIRKIASYALMIEKYYRFPQQIEWCIDAKGELYILQSRPLNILSSISSLIPDISERLKSYSIIFSRKGSVAVNGIAAGSVFVVEDDKDLDRFPPGAILVTRYSSPRLARVVRLASGIITDIGSSTGHMASIAREFRVPMIVNTGVATHLLKDGMQVTMDAEENVVYEGILKELCLYEFLESGFTESKEYRLLKRVLRHITPLNLIDPSDKNFHPRSCRTLHDITRYVHEKAVDALIRIHTSADPRRDGPARRLKIAVPIDLVLIDIGNGLARGTSGAEISISDIASLPMRAFIDGLMYTGAWDSEPVPVDFKGFMSSLTRTFSEDMATPGFVGQNLAVISANYANISLRLGYHFNMIDTYVGESINDNYLYFRFMGGVTDENRRKRRAKLIESILAYNDFMVERHADLVIGRIKKMGVKDILKRIKLTGMLVAFTRQLDARMASNDQVDMYMEKFMALQKSDS